MDQNRSIKASENKLERQSYQHFESEEKEM